MLNKKPEYVNLYIHNYNYYITCKTRPYTSCRLRSLKHTLNKSSFFFRTKNWPRTTYALSKPLSASLFPRTSPIPASSFTGFSPMGSLIKLRCFWLVLDMLLDLNK